MYFCKVLLQSLHGRDYGKANPQKQALYTQQTILRWCIFVTIGDFYYWHFSKKFHKRQGLSLRQGNDI
ncbi:MAG: hypothetical protein EZS28_020657 [Streblomastix strix]|uniref:Uncharacterized protein n=1 Tax=Streblomastix strix TaxID=222440 RepID=A0A5J4VMW2_9EUKA|nr:MAG: hypothetical protein EZS28_020657 [Streblomastix strix]